MSPREILDRFRTIAVVGLSSREWRVSYNVARYLQAHGYRIIPVNPNETAVLGETAYARLEDVPGPVEIVNVFRRSEHVPAIAESAIRIGARVLWTQEGVLHEGARQRALQAGLEVVMNRCIMTEHMS